MADDPHGFAAWWQTTGDPDADRLEQDLREIREEIKQEMRKAFEAGYATGLKVRSTRKVKQGAA